MKRVLAAARSLFSGLPRFTSMISEGFIHGFACIGAAHPDHHSESNISQQDMKRP
jgi:hypothetical protein